MSDSSRIEALEEFRRPVPGFWIFIGSAIFCWFSLFRLSGTPIWTGGDQTMWLEDGQRMLFGEVLYRDFFQMTFPGTELLYYWAFRLFGLRTWIPGALLVVTGATLTWLAYSISRRVLPARYALVPPLLLLTLVYHDLLDASHHWLSILCSAAALAVLIERRTAKRLFLAGVFCGLATCFTQSHGAALLAGFAVFLYLEQRGNDGQVWPAFFRKFGILLAGAGLTAGAVLAPFVWRAGLGRFFYCTAVYVLRYYSRFPEGADWRGYMIGLPSRLDLWHPWRLAIFLLIHLLLPLIYLLALLRCYRGGLAEDRESASRLLLIALVGLLLFLSVVSGPGWNRLYYVSFPALILFVFFVRRTGKRGALFLDATLGATLLLAVAIPVRTQLHRLEYLDLPGGRTAFLDTRRLEPYRWVLSRTRPFEYLFAPFSPDYHFLLGLRNPATVPVLTPFDFTRPQDVREAIDGLERHQVRLVLWSARLDLRESAATDHLGPLRAYIREHYCVTEELDEEEVWIRSGPPVSGRACPGTARALGPGEPLGR